MTKSREPRNGRGRPRKSVAAPPSVAQKGGERPSRGDAPEAIAQELRKMLVSGEIVQDGILQPITKMMDRFNVSRPTLRSALRILESEQLVSVKRGSRRGIQVLRPNVDAAVRISARTLQAAGANLGDLFDAREMYEPSAVRLLAQRHDNRDIAQLRAYVRRLDLAVEQHDAAQVAASAAQFHNLIMELTGNKVLVLVSDLISNVLVRYQVEHSTSLEEAMQEGLVQRNGVPSIRKLVSLIEAGDAEAAETHWVGHLQAAAKYWLKVQDRFETIKLDD